jgi:hypothetical protein
MTETSTNLWEEKNSTDHKMNSIKNEENDKCVTTGETKKDSTKKDWSITTKLNQNNLFSKLCPSCKEPIFYKWKQTLTSSVKDGKICKKCTVKINKGYSAEEEEILSKNYPNTGTAGCVKLLTNRSYGSVRIKAKQMGLEVIKQVLNPNLKLG